MNYYIRPAEYPDLERILEVYHYAREFMIISGNPNQWGVSHPAQSILEQDIRNGNLYVMLIDEQIHGVFAFIIGEDPTYRVIYNGKWHYSEEYGTIHRVAGTGRGGVFHSCVEFCSRRICHLRIDTHHDNRVMQSAIEREGFAYCGVIYVADGTPRLAYDRKKGSTA